MTSSAANSTNPASLLIEDFSTSRNAQRLLCISLLYFTVFFSIFGISAGEKEVPLSLLLALPHFAILALLTRGAFDYIRLLALGFAFAVVLIETALFHTASSPTSLLYIIAIYLPMVLVLPLADDAMIRSIWNHLSHIAIFIACCGLLQIALQFAAHGYFLDPLRLLPEKVRLSNYNTTYPIAYGASLLKPNGMFLLEPSFFSQFAALGLLGELLFFRRAFRIVLLFLAIFASASGTGFILLLPFILLGGSLRAIFGFLFLAGAGILLLFALGYGDLLIARSVETTQGGTSGNERFVAPYEEMVHQWEESPTVRWFGKGAGASERMALTVDSNFSAIPKVGIEYGMVGLFVFAVFWFSLFWELAIPPAATVATLLFYFVASGSFLQPFTVLTIWAITAGFTRRPQLSGATQFPVPEFQSNHLAWVMDR